MNPETMFEGDERITHVAIDRLEEGDEGEIAICAVTFLCKLESEEQARAFGQWIVDYFAVRH